MRSRRNGLIEHCRMIRVAHNRDSIGFRSVRAARLSPVLADCL
ncbi:hypothetical protein HMPREF3231_01459 [Bifidobacterium longum]|nr:hypothetical protein HMPREF3231_01459 [Bifidobacterium longum]